MAIIVRYKPNGGEYILLGTGYGVFKSSHPSPVFKLPVKESGTFPLAAICDYRGRIGWVRSANLEVVSVHGETPAEVLLPDVADEEVAGVPEAPPPDEFESLVTFEPLEPLD